MNVYLIIMEGNCGAVNVDDSMFHGYYITRFSSSPYTLQVEFSIDGQIVFSGEMVCEGDFLININSHYYSSPKNKSNNTIVSLRKIINGDINVIFFYSKDVVPSSLRSISYKGFSKISPLPVPIE